MRLRVPTVAILPMLALTAAWAGEPPATPTHFATTSIRFEQNVTDGDVEVVFDIQGGADGLRELQVVAPDGRTVIDFAAGDGPSLGMRKFVFESPEPKDVASLKAAFPEGLYRFSAATSAGAALRGECRLRHALPATAAGVQPAAEAEDVALQGVQITWKPVQGAVAYVVEVEQEDLGMKLETRLPASVRALAVPDGFLRGDTEYKLAIGTIAEDGNASFVESTFTTAAAH